MTATVSFAISGSAGTYVAVKGLFLESCDVGGRTVCGFQQGAFCSWQHLMLTSAGSILQLAAPCSDFSKECFAAGKTVCWLQRENSNGEVDGGICRGLMREQQPRGCLSLPLQPEAVGLDSALCGT